MYRDGFTCSLCGMVMGETAELVAREYGITRAQSDAYALESQRKAAMAIAEGAFTAEIQTAVNGIRDGKEPDLLSGQLARDALVLCHRECESVRTGKVVEVG